MRSFAAGSNSGQRHRFLDFRGKGARFSLHGAVIAWYTCYNFLQYIEQISLLKTNVSNVLPNVARLKKDTVPSSQRATHS